jgi:peptidoglycan DL-endopeptidase CwlO
VLLTLLITALLSIAGTTVTAGSAAAAPSDPDGNSPQIKALQAALDVAITDYNNAKGRVDASVARQAQLTAQQTQTAAKLKDLEARVGTVADAAYRGRRMNMAVAVLDSGSPEGMLHAASTVQYLVDRDDRDLHELNATRKQLTDEQTQLANELKLQQQQLSIMDAKRKDADAALRKAGGGRPVSGPTGGKVTANAAPRNADGSFASQSATIKDPTGTGGMITPRLLNAYNEARKAGFTHYTKCWRSQSSGEHPKGRACDFSANATTFVDARATGSDKTYGDNLAAWFIANASRLGVLYVIWYKRIWHPGRGWSSYSGDGTPAGDHYNHVHLSVQ